MTSQTQPLIETAPDLRIAEEEQAKLRPDERFVVSARAARMSHAAIAEQLGVTRARVAQIAARSRVMDAIRAEQLLITEEQDGAIAEWWPKAIDRLRTIALKGRHRESIQAIREARMIQDRNREAQEDKGGPDVLLVFAQFLGTNPSVFASRVPPDTAEEREVIGIETEDPGE